MAPSPSRASKQSLRRNKALAVGALALVALGVATVTGVLTGDRDGSPRDETVVDPNGFMRTACQIPASWARYVHRGWAPDPARDSDLAVVQAGNNWFGSFESTSHSGPQGFLQDVPLVLYGPGFIEPQGPIRLDREVTLADVPATAAALMDFDFKGEGTPISEVLSTRDQPPGLIVTVVIDGGGLNVLKQWPDATPNLRSLMQEGSSIEGAVVGSAPSITPAVHSTLSTGVFPREHGVMSIAMRHSNGSVAPSMSRNVSQGGAAADPTLTLEPTTLADEWDLANDNNAEAAMVAAQNFHLGMIGHGAALDGADKDIAVMLRDPMLATYPEDAWATNDEYFSLPSYINTEVEGPEAELIELDVADGKADGLWRGHDSWRLEATPAFSAVQTRVLEEIVTREGFGSDDVTDLFYINYKAPDAAGHRWNMIAPEQRDAVASVDEQLGRLVTFLDDTMGANYVLVVTADHGQTPLESSGWAIHQGELMDDLHEEVDKIENDDQIIQRTSAGIYFLNEDELKRNGITPGTVATLLSDYTIGDNLSASRDLPPKFTDRLDEKIFAAVVPGKRLDDLLACTSPD